MIGIGMLGWKLGCFLVHLHTSDVNVAAAVAGWRHGPFGIYGAEKMRGRGDESGAAYLVHIPSGLGLGAFASMVDAASAASVVSDLIDWSLPGQAHLFGSAVVNAWRGAGFYPTCLTDKSGNLIWRGSESSGRVQAT